jgi:hypothetical protein
MEDVVADWSVDQVARQPQNSSSINSVVKLRMRLCVPTPRPRAQADGGKQGEVLIEASGFCWLVRISYSGLAAGCLCRSQDMRYRHCSHVSVNDTVLQKRKTK